MKLLFRTVIVLYLINVLFLGCSSISTSAGMKAPTGEGPVSQTLRKHKDSFETCITHSVSLNSGENLKVTTRFIITPSGRVKSPALDRISAPDPDFGECILRRLSHLQFPSPKDGEEHEIKYTFVFEQN